MTHLTFSLSAGRGLTATFEPGERALLKLLALAAPPSLPAAAPLAMDPSGAAGSNIQGLSGKEEFKYPPDPGFGAPWSHRNAFGVITRSVRRREFTEPRGLVGRSLHNPG
ncbi:hypothetical protein CRG98_018195 [Punica granatum]|uniref:Uncharacterized protein n=1 Tax=Punica granatum TaxID=22663 RepID=A0A2I0JYM7_PUNGR|nr:hypothetical protein CRG98_018195 [Punica granatum]